MHDIALPHASNVAITHVDSHVLQMAALIQPADVVSVGTYLVHNSFIITSFTISLKD